MTIKTFWAIFIKIMGIWLVLGSVSVIFQFISPLFLAFRDNRLESMQIILNIGLLLLTIAVYIFILWLFVFKTDWLIEKLQLTKGFTEEKFDLNIQRSAILRIATIVIGGLMFVDCLPLLCKQIFTFLQQEHIFRESPSTVWIILYLIKTTIGYLLMTNSKFVVDFIDKQSAKQKSKTE